MVLVRLIYDSHGLSTKEAKQDCRKGPERLPKALLVS